MSCSYRSGYGYPLHECQEPVWPGSEYYIEGFNKTRATCNTFKHGQGCGPGAGTGYTAVGSQGMPCCYSNVMKVRCDDPLKVGGSQANTWCTYSYPKGYFMSPEDKAKFDWGW